MVKINMIIPRRVVLSRIERLWLRQSRGVRAMVLALIGFAMEFASDAIAHTYGANWSRLHLLEDFVSGLIYFCLGFWLANSQDRAVRKRSEMVEFLNHHCRNALQVISLAQSPEIDDELRKRMVSDAVARIAETLIRMAPEDIRELFG